MDDDICHKRSLPQNRFHERVPSSRLRFFIWQFRYGVFKIRLTSTAFRGCLSSYYNNQYLQPSFGISGDNQISVFPLLARVLLNHLLKCHFSSIKNEGYAVCLPLVFIYFAGIQSTHFAVFFYCINRNSQTPRSAANAIVSS